ncbi:MAG: thermonuclease family protein [Candidatus Micrarchaeia archaeon]|jgi:endonuclease YncB( thermonuclease family)
MVIYRKVKRAVDGDTLETYRKFNGTNYIRLNGINTPEKGQRGYLIAKRKMQRVENKVITVTPKARDKYGRIVADVRYKRKKVR